MSVLVRKEQLLVQRQKKRPTPFIQDRLSRTQEKKAKITQAELARRIGSDRSYISRVESGQTEPKVSTFYRIMNALGCKIEFSMIL